MKLTQHLPWKPVFLACLTAATLSACDSKKSPDAEPPAAKAGPSIGPSIGPAAPGTAAEPTASEATSGANASAAAVWGDGGELRKPHAAKPGEAALQSLESQLGKYPQDGGKYLEQGVLAERLKALLGRRHDALLLNLQTVGPLTKEGDLWSITGNRQYEGGTEAAAVVIDPARNAVRVWLLNRGAPTVYTDLPQGDIPWTESVNKFIANATSPK